MFLEASDMCLSGGKQVGESILCDESPSSYYILLRNLHSLATLLDTPC